MNVIWTVQLLILLATSACYVGIPVLLWVCFRRTGNQGFIWLGAALLTWPVFGYALNSFVGDFVDDAAGGHRSWLFPFSLMGGPDPSMTVGEFLALYLSMTKLLGVGLIMISLGVMARAFKKLA